MTGINLHANGCIGNRNHIAQEDIILWCYYSTSSVVISKSYFKDSGIRVLWTQDRILNSTMKCLYNIVAVKTITYAVYEWLSL